MSRRKQEEGKTQSPTSEEKKRAEEIYRRLLLAQQRVGGTPDARVRWVLDFVQCDCDERSPGDLLDLSDELRSYAQPIVTGFDVRRIPLEDKPSSMGFPMQKLKGFQSSLFVTVKDIVGSKAVPACRVHLELFGCINPSTSQFTFTWYSDNFEHLLTYRLFNDFCQIEMKRIRQCERGRISAHQKLGIKPCERYFLAADLRRRFCSLQCGKQTQWKQFWTSNRNAINKRRRKGG